MEFEYGAESVKRSVAFPIEGNKVAVRIAFGYASEACRGNKPVMSVLLATPASQKPAPGRLDGLLMKDAKAVKAPSVSFSWEPPEPPKK